MSDDNIYGYGSIFDLLEIKTPKSKSNQINIISSPYCPEDRIYFVCPTTGIELKDYTVFIQDYDFFWDEEEEEELKTLGLSQSEIDELSKHFNKSKTKSEFDDPKYDKYDLEKLEKQKHCWHKWVKVGTGPVTGEEWWNCKLCGLKKEEYEKSKK